MALAIRHRSAGEELDDRFDGVQVLHRGGRFTLYLARELATDREVVLKTPTGSGPRWLFESLEHQAGILARVGSHPNVITMLQRLDLADGRPALMLERSGRSLAQTGHDGAPMPTPAAVSIGIKLAGALATGHRAGGLHCVGRPGTVVMSEWGEPLLAGFDDAVEIGVRVDRPGTQVIRAHTAPELLQGEDATRRTDVYGLAATLYEMVAGRGAFRAYAGESPAAIIVRVLGGQVRPIVSPDVPLAVSDLLTWSMSADPSHRPPSPTWIAEELARIEAAQGWPRTRMIGG